MIELDTILHHTYWVYDSRKTTSSFAVQDGNNFSFFDAVWLLVQLSFLLSYGDVIPTDWTARLTVIFYILTIVLEVFYYMKTIIMYAKKISSLSVKVKLKNHFIVMGIFTDQSLARFLGHLRSPAHFTENRKKILIVQEEMPSLDLQYMISTHYFEDSIYL